MKNSDIGSPAAQAARMENHIKAGMYRDAPSQQSSGKTALQAQAAAAAKMGIPLPKHVQAQIDAQAKAGERTDD